ncbi:hypothetical protein BGW36DRAFT_367450 [Talaromyces proteolyticus]|uniref:Zn(2)-C6 fungal-type domain-containing protein n=1 Tax=Talaromyces proteolyticus TaxID=1131652 RepID=A0AAD4Q3T0_9EURO|nr:uncharacterized protein BGW36DRAFT_367450 [Talaromyces proteolyticus]KAH8705384.1 hypothetical protein BGW36DRAFT_367450 [Talaromyces proteolyticus]
MDESTAHVRGAPRRACDNCRRRKIRCNRNQPCAKCEEIQLVCQYNDTARRKGPKGRTAPVLTELLATGTSDGSGMHNYDSQHANDVVLDSLQSSLAPLDDSPYSADYDTSLLVYDISTASIAPVPRRISSPQLRAYVQAFLQQLYPIMPVVDGNALLLDCAGPEALHPRRYALLVALSAAAHFQLNFHMPEKDVDPDTLRSGYHLIREAEQALHQFDPFDDLHADTILIRFFLFAAYGNLREPDRAWYYLNQSLSFAHILKLNMESTYEDLDQNEAEILRRIYWLLFVTERAYALQTGRPIMLRATIKKPVVFQSESPTTMYGFTSLISLFEKITPDFYEWNICDIGGMCDLSSLSDIYKSVAFATPLLAEVPETNRVDIILTQQWLQTRLWRFYMDRQYLHGGQSNTGLPKQTPTIAGRIVMACLSSVAQKSADSHGIGIEQKLYDIGESIFQFTQQLCLKTAESLESSKFDARDVLSGILTSLSRIRGSQSYLFPALLQQCQGLLSLGNVPPPLSETSVAETDEQEFIERDSTSSAVW